MFQVQRVDRSNPNFYQILGPVFGSRSIAKEVGIHCYDDADKQFFVVLNEDNLIGLASLKNSVVSDCYVHPNFRNAGVFSKILSFLMRNQTELKAICTEKSRGVFLKAGFSEVGRTKNFYRMKQNA